MIYFIKSESGHVKIGFTNDKNINKRLSVIQCGNPYKLEILRLLEWEYDQEYEIKKHFEKHKVRGEWFNLNQEIIDYTENPYKFNKHVKVSINQLIKRLGAVRSVAEELGISERWVKDLASGKRRASNSLAVIIQLKLLGRI
ncbi:hypothetical protein LCGC14_1749250 [marine sediment metagenome]|uniref:Bacteriophage T5 Orf172 DNA-binding domain-containing protein n=1 Tax=marine sediment metagenome TaxID=412755 RepID=A0A0F9JJI8_9ZZZZ|nr:hypothetical protein [Desulfobacterales bacterium]